MTQKDSKSNQQACRYIVEAPRPTQGQVMSSGGLREKGRLVSQYKNPVPYYPLQEKQIVYVSNRRSSDIGSTIGRVLWEELVVPIVRDGLNRLADKVVEAIFEPPKKTKATHVISASTCRKTQQQAIVTAITHEVKEEQKNREAL